MADEGRVKERKITVGTSVPVEVLARLDLIAYDTRTSLSSILRGAIYEWLEKHYGVSLPDNDSDDDEAA